MKRKHIPAEEQYRNAMQKITPDVYPAILEACRDPRRTSADDGPPLHTGKALPFRMRYRYRSAAAAVLLLILGFSGGRYYLGGSAVVSLDVNPSISLKVNRLNRVTGVNALNEDGETILGEMNLKGTDIDVAVNALIGAMVKAGYLSEMENSVLLSVLDEDGKSGKELQTELTQCIQQAFDGASIEGAVISQRMTASEAQYQELAGQFHISEGKAALACQIAAQNSTITADDIAALSVNDINLLASSQGFELGDAQALGTASSKGYIGEEKAAELAFDYSRMAPADVRYLQVAMDYKSGIVTDEVEFYKDEYKYEYELDASDGDLLEWESEWKRADLLEAELQELEREKAISGISKEQALAIAADHAGVALEDILFSKITPAYEQETEFFDVEFVAGEYEYEYKINPSTGEILEYTHITKAYP